MHNCNKKERISFVLMQFIDRYISIPSNMNYFWSTNKKIIEYSARTQCNNTIEQIVIAVE